MSKKYFYGQELSPLELEKGYISYYTLAKCGNIVQIDPPYDDLELENGCEHDENDDPYEIFQYFAICDTLADILKRNTDEFVYWCKPLNCYIWGITHFGTSWEYVSTDIEIEGVEWYD